MAQPTIALRDFFRNPQYSSFSLSPNGKHISFMKPYKGRMNIFVRPTQGGEEKQLTFMEERDIQGYFWKGNDRIVYVNDFGGDENFHLFSTTLEGSEPNDITPFDNVKVQIIDDLEEQPSEILISMNKEKPEWFDVYRLNLDTEEMTLVARNPGSFTAWQTDHEGVLRLGLQTDGVNSTIMYRDNENADFEPILTTDFKETLSPVLFTPDNSNLFCLSNIDRNTSAVIEFNPKTQKEERVIYQHPEVDTMGLSYSRKRKKLTAANFVTDKVHLKFFDDETELLYQRLQEHLPDYEISLTSRNDDETLFVVMAYGDRTRDKYYLYDTTTDELTFLSSSSDWLDEDDLASMHPISFQSRDGLTIHGYLTLPNGETMESAKDLPVIVNPHGGPWVRDMWGFNPEIQFLANRGYAILQVNYRGSTGYGKEFWEASFKQWGRAMQDDLTDAAHWLTDKGIADKNRIAIYGASYGGYATLAGLAFTDVYCCGVDYVGVSNLITFMKTIPPYWKPMLEMMYEMVGNPETEHDQLVAASPVFHADKISAPLLVAQGAKDPRVNIEESNQIVDALKKRGIDVPYIVKENEGHGFRNEENRFEFYEAMEAFLAKHM
jgi:dipeptidyl aminopeptidase/acylaminoacyl peptidase